LKIAVRVGKTEVLANQGLNIVSRFSVQSMHLDGMFARIRYVFATDVPGAWLWLCLLGPNYLYFAVMLQDNITDLHLFQMSKSEFTANSVSLGRNGIIARYLFLRNY